MESVVIAGHGDVDEVQGIIDKHFLHSKTKIDEQISGDRYKFTFNLAKLDPLGEIAVYNSLSTIIDSIIEKIYLVDFITEEVTRKYGDFSALEQENIIYLATKVVRTDLVYKAEKKEIKELINDYLMKNRSINIDGFLRFRLREYDYMIEDTVSNVVSEINAKKKYEEFIMMLRYFVELQIPKYNYLDVVIEQDGYKILDESGVEIEDDSIQNIKDDFHIHAESTQTDMLLSSLVVLSPRTFTVHVKYGREKELLDVLRSVFESRLRLCHGCNRCGVEKL